MSRHRRQAAAPSDHLTLPRCLEKADIGRCPTNRDGRCARGLPRMEKPVVMRQRAAACSRPTSSQHEAGSARGPSQTSSEEQDVLNLRITFRIPYIETSMDMRRISSRLNEGLNTSLGTILVVVAPVESPCPLCFRAAHSTKFAISDA
jgi:hypothetical protein